MASSKRTSEDQWRTEVEAAFKEYDTNGDGVITLKEAYVVLESCLGFNKDATKRLMRTCDTNRDGCLSLEEFEKFYYKVKAKMCEMRALFHEFDRDHDGHIEMEEAKIALRQMALSDGEIEQIVRNYDTDGDGRIQYNEFLKLWNAS